MAEIALSATINIQSNITLILTKQEYLWTTKSDIQRFLDADSVIQIANSGTNHYDEADAMAMENGIVREIIAYLSSVYEIDEDSDSALLQEITAMLTASKIGLARMGSSMGNETADWTNRLKNEAWATLQQCFVNQNLAELTAVSLPLWKRSLLAKRREMGVVRNV